MLLLLLLSHFRRVQLCVTPQTAAHQAPPSLGFSRQEHWSGLPFPSPMHESETWKWVIQSCPTRSNPMDGSLPGSSIHGIFQARVLEWGAITFSYFAIILILTFAQCVLENSSCQNASPPEEILRTMVSLSTTVAPSGSHLHFHSPSPMMMTSSLWQKVKRS